MFFSVMQVFELAAVIPNSLHKDPHRTLTMLSFHHFQGRLGWGKNKVKIFVDVLRFKFSIMSIRSTWSFCEVSCETVRRDFSDQPNVLLCYTSVPNGSNNSNRFTQKTLDPENVMRLSLSRMSRKRHDTGICESRISFLKFIRFTWLVPRPFNQVPHATIPRDFS